MALFERDPIRHEELRRRPAGLLGHGTFACPSCDAPVAPGDHPLALRDLVACPYCRRVGAVRDFLSLQAPTRPARVEIRLRIR